MTSHFKNLPPGFIVPATSRPVRPKPEKPNGHATIYERKPTTKTFHVGETKIIRLAVDGERIDAATGDRWHAIPRSLKEKDMHYIYSQGGTYRLCCEGGAFSASIRPHKYRKDGAVASLDFIEITHTNKRRAQPAQCFVTLQIPPGITDLSTCLHYDSEKQLLFWGLPGRIRIIDPLRVNCILLKELDIGEHIPTAVTVGGMKIIYAAKGNVWIMNFEPVSVQFIKSLADETASKSEGAE